MDIDKLVAFQALEHYGVRVARSAYVDSENSAVAFAERRDAPDPRFMPIVLRSTAALAGARAQPLKSVDAVRDAFKLVSSEKIVPKEVVLAQVFIPDGTDVAITGTTDATVGKMLSLGSDIHATGRAVPLTPETAAAIGENYLAYGHHGSSAKTRLMLTHLLMLVSEFFEETGVTDLHLDVRLHDNAYSVVDASMIAPKPLHVKKRLGHRAHDRKGDEYHPAGRQ